jgi:hypothetical protein
MWRWDPPVSLFYLFGLPLPFPSAPLSFSRTLAAGRPGELELCIRPAPLAGRAGALPRQAWSAERARGEAGQAGAPPRVSAAGQVRLSSVPC